MENTKKTSEARRYYRGKMDILRQARNCLEDLDSLLDRLARHEQTAEAPDLRFWANNFRLWRLLFWSRQLVDRKLAETEITVRLFAGHDRETVDLD